MISFLSKHYGNKEPIDVSEIICDNINIKEINEESKVALEKYQKAKILSLNSCQLKNLKNLPNISSIEEIQLSDNHINGQEIKNLLIYPRLSKIKLCNNIIKEVSELESLKKLSDLVSLDLSECPITKIDNYRQKVFELLPDLLYLDLVNKQGENYSELEDQEDEEEEDEEDEDDKNDSFVVKDEEEEEEDEEDEDEENEKKEKKKKVNEDDDLTKYVPNKKRKLE